MVRYFSIVIILLIASLSLQAQNLLSYVTVNNTTPYVGQPVQVKVNVYTTTWFTSGIDVGNIQVDKALSVFFRSVSSVKTINRKKYAGVEFYYNLFPTEQGTITIPSLKIHVETPKEGGYKGIKRTLKTKPKSITVKPVPLGYDPQKWLVASSLSVNQKWSIPLNHIKVGDVVQRTINRYANGTLSEFIPATHWDSIAGISLYLNRPKANTNKSRTGVSSNRSETVNYLFEKEGDIVIPKMSYMYWNAATKKFYQKQLDSIIVSVKPNADLAMLTSIKKSLQKQQVEEAEIESPFLIFGLQPKTFIKYVLFGLLALIILVKIVNFIASYIKTSYQAYLRSEKYAFKQVIKAISGQHYASYSKAIQIWLTKLNDPRPTLNQIIETYGTDEVKNTFNHMNEERFKFEKTNTKSSTSIIKHGLIHIRKLYLKDTKTKHNTDLKNQDWLNPKSL